MKKVSVLVGVVSVVSAISLTSCSKVEFSNVAGPLCVKTTNIAATAYAKAITPTAQEIAERAVDTAIVAGERVAKLVAQGKSGVAKDIENILVQLRARKTATNLTGSTLTALRDHKAVIVSSLADLGSLCAKAVKVATN